MVFPACRDPAGQVPPCGVQSVPVRLGERAGAGLERTGPGLERVRVRLAGRVGPVAGFHAERLRLPGEPVPCSGLRGERRARLVVGLPLPVGGDERARRDDAARQEGEGEDGGRDGDEDAARRDGPACGGRDGLPHAVVRPGRESVGAPVEIRGDAHAGAGHADEPRHGVDGVWSSRRRIGVVGSRPVPAGHVPPVVVRVHVVVRMGGGSGGVPRRPSRGRVVPSRIGVHAPPVVVRPVVRHGIGRVFGSPVPPVHIPSAVVHADRGRVRRIGVRCRVRRIRSAPGIPPAVVGVGFPRRVPAGRLRLRRLRDGFGETGPGVGGERIERHARRLCAHSLRA